MPRPPVERRLGSAIAARGFKPSEAGTGDEVILSFDEAEALRLADLEGLYQQAAAQRMGVSRQTFGRIVEAARKKTADALLNGKSLRIEGGPVAIGGGPERPRLIAVPRSEDGTVADHFGFCSSFSLFSTENNKTITSERRLDLDRQGGCNSGLIPALAAEGVTHLIAGRIGEGALRVLGSHGIAVFRGALGPVREAAEALLGGTLVDGEAAFDPPGHGCRDGHGHGGGGPGHGGGGGRGHGGGGHGPGSGGHGPGGPGDGGGGHGGGDGGHGGPGTERGRGGQGEA